MAVTRSNRILIILTLSFFLSGLLEVLLPKITLILQLHMVAVVILTFVWCQSYAAERELSLPRAYLVFAALIPLLGVPIYFVRALGWRPALWRMVLSVGFLLVLIVAYIIPLFTVAILIDLGVPGLSLPF